MLTDDEKILFNTASKYFNSQPVIFDIGAHKGAYTEYVLSQINDAKCFLFEPNTELFKGLSEQYATAFNILLSNQTGTKDFYKCIGDADELSSAYNRPVFSEVAYIAEAKECTTIDHFCNEKHIEFIDFLKIDVEGAELDVLNGCVKMLSQNKIMFLQVEYGGTYPDAGITFNDVMNLIEPYGYNIYEIVNGSLIKITRHNFIEDYRFANFLITRNDIG